MSSDEPFDVDAPPGSGSTPQRPSSRPHAPGRRPAQQPHSRARAGGSAQPLDPARQRRPQQQRQPGARSAGAGAPPTFRPGGEGRPHEPGTEGGPRTRVMPASSTGSARRPQDAPPAGRSGGRISGGAGSGPGRSRSGEEDGRRPGGSRRRRRRLAITVLVLVLVALLAWPVGLLVWANGQIQHTAALSGSAGTPGTTYLLAGSDSRDDDELEQGSLGSQRTDTIMLLHVPSSGASSLISLPRDTYVEIPGHGGNKINAAYAFGGAPLLVETVESLTSIDVDHYVEIGMGGVAGLVDAVGGVELCLDDSTGIQFPVNDERSELVWDAPGCQQVDGSQALAFARMRYADPMGDIGRTARQQQVIQAVTGALADPWLAFRPGDQVDLASAGLGALTVSDGTGIIDLGRLALAFRDATGPDGVRGTPPIASLNYQPGGIGSAVLLDPDSTPAFFESVLDGSVAQDDVGQ